MSTSWISPPSISTAVVTRSWVRGRGALMPRTRRSMLAASKMPMTIGKLRSPSTSRSMMTCDSWISLMMIRFNSIWTGTCGLTFVQALNQFGCGYCKSRLRTGSSVPARTSGHTKGTDRRDEPGFAFPNRPAFMKIHEYQAKELLAAEGAPIPKGIVASNTTESTAAFDQYGGKPVVLKAQVHAGGRGKGRFKDSGKDFGGVKFCTKREQVADVADTMFKYPLVTKQTGAEGQKVSKVLVQEAADIAREIYVGMVLDRALGVPILMACAEGGVEIEEVAARSPEKILKVPVAPEAGLLPYQSRRLAFELGF